MGNASLSLGCGSIRRITSVGGVPFTSDANGNLTSRGGDQLTYDQANRLITAAAPGMTANYQYDGDGKRTGKAINGTTVNSYVYDIKAATPKLLSDGQRVYVWRPTLAYSVSAADASQIVNVYHTDGIDSARVLTDGQGNVTDVERTDAFGVVTNHQGVSGQPFGFAGEQRDAESGLMLMGARAYDSLLGRFIQRDTMGGSRKAPSTLHRFVYSLNNPGRYVDPSGLDADDGVNTDLTSEITGTCCDGAESGGPLDGFLTSVMGQVSDAFASGAQAAYFGGPDNRVAQQIFREPEESDAEAGGAPIPAGPLPVAGGAPASPSFVVTDRGVAIPVPSNAQGPIPARGNGVQYVNGTGGGNGLDERVVNVRIMDPTPAKGNAPAYPDGNVVYSNGGGQPVDPSSGRIVDRTQMHHSLTP